MGVAGHRVGIFKALSGDKKIRLRVAHPKSYAP